MPYALDALEPCISAQAMDLHYNKHYAGYVKKAIALTSGTACGGKTPEEVIRMTAGDAAVAGIFNNAAQAWNHAFYFKVLKPKGGGEPEGRLAEMIDDAFGSYDDFKEAFIKAASSQFGSGWAWLVLKDGQLAIFTGGNADTPIAHDMLPLFCVDVWEHAYYLDYQNRRAEFVETVLDKLANWEFVASQLPEDASPAAGEAVTEAGDEPAVAPEAEAEVTEEAVEAEAAPAQAPETTHEPHRPRRKTHPMPIKRTTTDLLETVRRTAPLIHNITNLVVMNTTANILLAMGASPVMAHSRHEVAEMAAMAKAVVINIGTLSDPWVEAMLLAARAANQHGLPVILDPVGAGATAYRSRSVRNIIDDTAVSVIRGNASEVLSLADAAVKTRGVDSSWAFPMRLLMPLVPLPNTMAASWRSPVKET